MFQKQRKKHLHIFAFLFPAVVIGWTLQAALSSPVSAKLVSALPRVLSVSGTSVQQLPCPLPHFSPEFLLVRVTKVSSCLRTTSTTDKCGVALTSPASQAAVERLVSHSF